MLSVASLLNPVKLEPRAIQLSSSPSPSFCTSPSTHGSPQPPSLSTSKKQKMTKDCAVFTKGKIKGDVNFPPFENLDEETTRLVEKFQVYPLGKITEYPRHIPYNSEKKNFLEKTGRESFEVFQYIFKIPGDDKDYTVMWDYNVGLVRITPFFKCCKYSKTTPAKMLSMNPGLKEITHSITGGALVAQGYWMPYSCALAICSTFCAHIAPSLIPIFGPTFPALCVPPEAPEHGRMIIEQSTIKTATAEAEAFRSQHAGSTSVPGGHSPPIHRPDLYNRQLSGRSSDLRRTPPNLGRRLRLKRAYGGESPYRVNTDTDVDTNGSEASSGDGYFCSPLTPHSSVSPTQPPFWKPLNHQPESTGQNLKNDTDPQFKTSNPLLSAIPRSTCLANVNMDISGRDFWQLKRRGEPLTPDYGADGNHDGRMKNMNIEERKQSVVEGKYENDIEMRDVGGVEKKAAWLLMKLSVKDGEAEMETLKEKVILEGPRVKRRRATSV